MTKIDVGRADESIQSSVLLFLSRFKTATNSLCDGFRVE